MPQPIVRFTDVTKRYGNLTVLNNLNLDVEAGEKVALGMEPGGGHPLGIELMGRGRQPIQGLGAEPRDLAGRTLGLEELACLEVWQEDPSRGQRAGR